MLTFHVFQNIGMTIQVLPITGIPLPFISYGGSSLMGNMFAMGLMFGISWHHKRYMFGKIKETMVSLFFYLPIKHATIKKTLSKSVLKGVDMHA